MAVAGVLYRTNTEQKKFLTACSSKYKEGYPIQTPQRNLELPVIATCCAYNAFIQYLKPLRAVLRQHWEAMTELV